MNLFFKRLTGKLMSTEKFEKKEAQLLADAKRYQEVEKSAELKELVELEALVAEPRFQAIQKEYMTKKYKETVEYKNYTDFKELKNDKIVRQYLEATNDEDRAKLSGTIAVKNYLQLKDIVDEAGFESRRLFWEDEKRWYQTEEYKKVARMEELQKSDDIKFYRAAKNIQTVAEWHETFAAPFLNTTLEKNGLKTGFWFQNPAMKRDFSHADGAQAYMGDRNINIINGVLSIVMKKGAVEAAVWDGKKGFHMQQFDYSSANINSGDSFSQAGGRFTAKVRATGKSHGALYLVAEDRSAAVELYHYNGKRIEVGVSDNKARETEVLKGLPAGNWYIFDVEIADHEIIWKVNNMEVYRAIYPLADKKVYLSAECFAPANKGGEGQIDFEWIKAYTK